MCVHKSLDLLSNLLYVNLIAFWQRDRILNLQLMNWLLIQVGKQMYATSQHKWGVMRSAGLVTIFGWTFFVEQLSFWAMREIFPIQYFPQIYTVNWMKFKLNLDNLHPYKLETPLLQLQNIDSITTTGLTVECLIKVFRDVQCVCGNSKGLTYI